MKYVVPFIYLLLTGCYSARYLDVEPTTETEVVAEQVLLTTTLAKGYFNLDNPIVKTEIENNRYGLVRNLRTFPIVGYRVQGLHVGVLNRILVEERLPLSYQQRVLVHEIYHDFWNRILTTQQRQQFRQQAIRLREELLIEYPVLQSIAEESSRKENSWEVEVLLSSIQNDLERAIAVDVLFIKHRNYRVKGVSSHTFLGTEVFAFFGEQSFLYHKISCIPESLRPYYSGLVNEEYFRD